MNNLKIINYLGKNINSSFTMNNLSKLINIPYATFYRTIKELQDIITVQTIGKAKVISLKITPITKSYLTISSEEEKKEFLKKQPIINKITAELNTEDIILLFGSYAKQSQKSTSDIDILVINKEGNNSISFSKYETLFNKKINPIFITKIEFKKMINEKEENLGKQALKNHIILNNPEKFWELVL